MAAAFPAERHLESGEDCWSAGSLRLWTLDRLSCQRLHKNDSFRFVQL